MTRVVLVIAMAIVLAVIVVAPARNTAADFLETIIAEHGLNSAVFGEDHAGRILHRMEQMRTAIFGPTVHEEPWALGAHGAPQQFGRSAYGSALDAMLVLGLYRASYFLEFLPLLVPFLLVFLVDGLAVRAVRSREFLPHSPGVYGLVLFCLLIVASLTVIAFFLPAAIHPLVLMASPIVAAFLVGRAAANYHKHSA